MRERVESMGVAPMLRDNDVRLEAGDHLGQYLAEALQPGIILGVWLHRDVHTGAERVAFSALIHSTSAGE
ncbi:hypothetical protein D3C85_1227450 [compost metagenome]